MNGYTFGRLTYHAAQQRSWAVGFGRATVLVSVLFWVATGRAAEPTAAPDLTLDEVVRQALADNPDLRRAKATWEAMQEGPAQARALPNPMVRFQGMDAADGGDFPDTGEKRYMVEQAFPWLGKRGLREDMAAKDAEAMQRDFEAMRLETVMMVKETYFSLYAVQHARDITAEEEAVLKRLEQIAEAMYATGTRSQQDVLKAEAETTMLRQKLLDLDQQKNVLSARLNQLRDLRADTPLGRLVTPPVAEEEIDAETAFAAAAEARPEILRVKAQIERSEYERDLMRKEYWPDYELGLEYRDFASDEDMVMFTVGFDLPLWRSNYRAGVREAAKKIAAARAELEAEEQQVSFDVQDARFKLRTARQTRDLYRDELVPQAEARFAASEAGYKTGAVDFLDLLESERFLLNVRVMLAMAEGDLGMQGARLVRAIGKGLPEQSEGQE